MQLAVAIHQFHVTFSLGLLLHPRFSRVVKLSDIQVYIVVIIIGLYNLQGFGVVLLFCFVFGFVFV